MPWEVPSPTMKDARRWPSEDSWDDETDREAPLPGVCAE